MKDPTYTIGFTNLTEKLSFAVSVRKSLELAASRYPNLNLVVRNNEQDNERALANAQELANMPVDIALIYHIDERAGLDIIQILQRNRIPVISIEVAIPLTIFFGIDNREAGLQSGEALGKWIQANWDGHVDKILILGDYRLTGMVRQRLDYAAQKMLEILGKQVEPFPIHSGNIRETATQNVLPILTNWGKDVRIAIIGQNDDTTLGAIDAARSLGIEENVVGVGYGATELALDELRSPDSRLVASVDMHPEEYGTPLLELALRMLNGEKVPRENLIQPACLTSDDFRSTSN